MSQLKKKNHCVEQVKHMFNHLCAPEDDVACVPIKEAKWKQKCSFPPHWLLPVVLLKVWVKNTAALLNQFILGLQTDKKCG